LRQLRWRRAVGHVRRTEQFRGLDFGRRKHGWIVASDVGKRLDELGRLHGRGALDELRPLVVRRRQLH